MKDIFETARAGDLQALRSHIQNGADLTRTNAQGFTPLHCASMGSDQADPGTTIEILKLLIEAGSDIEQIGGGGRTALYLLAEFSRSIAPVEFLIRHGANPDVRNQ